MKLELRFVFVVMQKRSRLLATDSPGEVDLALPKQDDAVIDHTVNKEAGPFMKPIQPVPNRFLMSSP
ncbi:MAG: hypothetical protein AAGH89_04790 [Verrucomicrobiota bacterium]